MPGFVTTKIGTAGPGVPGAVVQVQDSWGLGPEYWGRYTPSQAERIISSGLVGADFRFCPACDLMLDPTRTLAEHCAAERDDLHLVVEVMES